MSAEPALTELSLLDAFRLVHAGEEVECAVPAQRVLAYLALRRRPVLRDHAAEELWLEFSSKHALGSLRSALWKLRRPGCELVRVCGCRLQLDPAVRVDVLEALAWARSMASPATRRGIDLSGLAYTGDLLPDWYDDWVTLERERFRLLRAQALEELCFALSAEQRYTEALDAALTAIEVEPLRESAHRALMHVHLAQGNPAAVVDQYQRFRSRLSRDVGLAPSAQMRELVTQAQSG